MGLPQGGVSPTICCGAHVGCQPKVMETINKDEYDQRGEESETNKGRPRKVL